MIIRIKLICSVKTEKRTNRNEENKVVMNREL